MSVGKARQGYKKIPWLFRKEIEIPEEWKVRKTDDVFEFLISGTNARSDLNDSSEIGYIHYGDIHTKWNLQLDCDLEKIPRIDKEKVSRLPLLKDGDLIIADASEDVEGSGISILLKNVKNKKIVAGLHTLVLRSKDENISFEFMKYLTSISHVKIQITSYVTGSKVFGLSKKSCKEIKVPFPELPEQQKIASILSNVDTQIQQTKKLIDLTQRLKKGLMQNLLTRGIGHTKFKKINYIFKKQKSIPENWNLDIVENICEKTVVGFVGTIDPFYTSEKGVLLIRTSNIMEGELDLTSVKYVTKEFHDKNKKSQIKNNDLLVARHGTNGEACLVKNIKEANCLNIVLMRPDTKKINSSFLEYFFNYDFTRKQIIRLTAGGVQNVVNTKELAKIKILVPPLEEQQKIASILSNVDEQINQHKNEKALLGRIKNGLMQQLLTGQRRVILQ